MSSFIFISFMKVTTAYWKELKAATIVHEVSQSERFFSLSHLFHRRPLLSFFEEGFV